MGKRTGSRATFVIAALLVLGWIPAAAMASSAGLAGTPLNIGAVLDAVAETPVTDAAGTGFEVRALELNLGAPVDPYFDMTVTIAYEGGEFGVEEAWVTSILPWNFKLLAGREKLPFGYLNRLHEHDYPQVDQPYVLKRLLGDDGMVGDGAHLEWMAPLINPTLTLMAGVYDSLGSEVGRRMGGNPWMARAQSYYQTWSGAHSVLVGASYLGGLGDRDYAEGYEADWSALGRVRHMVGADVKYRMLTGGRTLRGLTLAGEYLYADYRRNLESNLFNPDEGGDANLSVGADQGLYGYAQWDFDRFWGAGYRFDRSDLLFSSSQDDALITAHSVYAEWRGTEFSRIRLQYQHNYTRDGAGGGILERDNLVMLQGTFFIGWHPPHRF